MTWQEAKAHAQNNIELIKTSITDSGINLADLKGQEIPIVEYSTRRDFETLRPEDRGKLTHLDHNQIIKATQRLIRSELKAKPILIKIKAQHYLRWLSLNKIENTTDNRAAYIAQQQLLLSQLPKILIAEKDPNDNAEESLYIIQTLESIAIAKISISTSTSPKISIWTTEPWKTETLKQKFIKQVIKKYRQERQIPFTQEIKTSIDTDTLTPPAWIQAHDPDQSPDQETRYIIKTTHPQQITRFSPIHDGQLQGTPLIYNDTPEMVKEITQESYHHLTR